MKLSQKERVLEHLRDAYSAEPEHLWAQYPDYGVYRHPASRKWYALIMDVPKKKLKLEGDGVAEILDIRFDPDRLAQKIDLKHFFPAYHMNKKHWITILLDGGVSPEEIFGYIDDSYQMAKK